MSSGSSETGLCQTDLNPGIRRGIEFLGRSQLLSGEFKVYVSPDLNL